MSDFTNTYLKLRNKRRRDPEEDESRVNRLVNEETEESSSRPKSSFQLNTLALISPEEAARATAPDAYDIAPVREVEQTRDKEDKRTWFQKGAFEDGYQFGDVTKTVLGSSQDLRENVAAGILGIGEKVVDAGAMALGVMSKATNKYAMQTEINQNAMLQELYGALGIDAKLPDAKEVEEFYRTGQTDLEKDLTKFVAKDLYDEREVAKYAVGNPINYLLGVDSEEDSIWGDKVDSLAQSGGQLAATAGLQAVGVPWWLTTGITTYGSEAENALNSGASLTEANLSGLISAGAEILTEKLSGGISFGGKTLDDALTKALARGISNKTARMILKLSLDAGGEGLEEVFSNAISAVGQKLTYDKDKDTSAKELLFSEEAFENFLGGVLLGGGSSAGKAYISHSNGIDAVTGLKTDTEQKVVDKEYKDRIAQEEAAGKKLTQKDKAKIYDGVLNDLEKGYISTNTIEEVLGGEEYTSYQDTVKNEEALKKELDELRNMKSGDMTDIQRDRLTELKGMNLSDTTKRNELRAKLDEKMKKLVTNNSRLAESYNERARRSQAFEADLSQYDSKQAAVVQKAIESGILNNTNRTHEFVDMVSKISADKGVLFDFANNAKLKESGFAIDGATINGYVTKDGVTLNIDSAKALNSVVGHEITHVLEGTELYGELQKAITEYAKSKGDYQGRYDSLSALYKDVEGADIDAELTADLVGDYLFTDADFINNLSTKHRNIFEKIYDEIKYMYKMATAGSKQARELEKVKRAFDKAYKESGKASGDTKYSLAMVDAVKPTSDKWAQGATTDEVRAKHPTLYAVDEDATEQRNPTQVKGTVGSYRNIYNILKQEGFNGTILDASSGLGYGTKAGIEEYGFKVDDIEPYPDSDYKPKYTDYSTLDKTYDAIISNAVLNVLPQDQRNALVVKMGELLNPGGRMFINVRGKDVLNSSGKIAINEANMEYFIPRTAKTGSYQKGFTKTELVAYLQDALGEGYTVEPTNKFGAVSAIVTKDGAKYSLSDSDGNTKYADTFYSQMAKVVDDVKQEKLGASSVVNMLRGKGVKAEEIKWSGIEAWLEGKKSVTKAELQEFVAGSQLQVEEQGKGDIFETRYKNDNELVLMRNGKDELRFEWDEDEEAWKTVGADSWFNDEDEILDAAQKGYGSTKWEEYKLEGGTNYRELVFKMPNSTYSNSAMKAHWGEDAEGILAHARIQDFTVNGKKMLFIEEIQSDWHNEGHKKGYNSETTLAHIRELEGQIAQIDSKVDSIEKEYDAFLTRYWEENLSDDEYTQTVRGYQEAKMELTYKRKDISNEINSLKENLGVPDAPFRDNYHEYVLKRLLRMAAEEGYDSIGWTPADIQSERWSDEYAEGYRIEYDQDIPKFLRKYGKKWGAIVGQTTMPYLESRTTFYDVNRREDFSGYLEWEDAVERDLRAQGAPMRNLEYKIDGDYYIAYDKVSGIEYDRAEIRRSGNSVWSMNITDAMMQSVLYEGQPKFSLSSMANTFFGDENMSAKEFAKVDYKQTQGYKDYVDQCVNNYQQTRADFDESVSRQEIEEAIDGIVKVAIAAKKAGYDIQDNATKRSTKDSKNRLLFSSLEPNSDYFTSNDISTICDKRQNFADIYDDIVKAEEAKGVPVGKRFFDNVDNYFYLHKLMADKGLTQPCRQCYVESMRKNLAPMANAFLRLVQETDSNNKANDQLYHPSGKNKGELKTNNAATREWVLDKLASYGMSASDLTVEKLTTEDGLAQLKIQAPMIYEAFNSFYGQSKPKMPKAATPFRFGELTALLTDERGKIKQSLVDKINSTGGFRLQSYSDFQIKNYTDTLQVIFEAGTLGLDGHAYTKVPAFLDATEGTGLKRNISIFMYKDGNEWKLDRNDSFPAPLEEIYDIVNADKSGNTSIIAVSQNADMSAWIMANDNVGYGIPFHKSGMKMGTVRDTDVKTEDGRIIKGYSGTIDHTKQQTEVWARTNGENKALTKVKKGVNIYRFWDFDNKSNLSKNELIEKNVKAYIDACEDMGYLPKFRDYVINNEKVLNNVLKYSKDLGFVAEDATIEDISFEYKTAERTYRIPYGYYKFLGDFGMFTPDGKASPHEVLSLKNYDFDKAVQFFADSESLRRNEILQQFANDGERQKYRDSDLDAEELEKIVKQKRGEIVDDVVAPTRNPDIRFSLSEYTAEEKKAHNDAVVNHFGKTYSWAETGYLLLDGTRLDLSGKHDGAPGGYRTVDHRDITEALGYDYGGGDYSGSLVQFMSEGNIRIIPECNGINLSVKPTKAQEQALSNYISRFRGEVMLDIDDLNGNTVVSVEYPYGTYYTTVLNDIREWFDNGKKPENAGSYSLTKEGETSKQYGIWNIRGEDVAFNPAQEDISKVENTTKGIAPVVDTVDEVVDKAVKAEHAVEGIARDNPVLHSRQRGENWWGDAYDTAMAALQDAVKNINGELLNAFDTEFDNAIEKNNMHMPITNAFLAVQEDVRQGTISPMQGARLLSEAYANGGVDALDGLYNGKTGNLHEGYLEQAKKYYTVVPSTEGVAPVQVDETVAPIAENIVAPKKRRPSRAALAKLTKKQSYSGGFKLQGAYNADGKQYISDGNFVAEFNSIDEKIPHNENIPVAKLQSFLNGAIESQSEEKYSVELDKIIEINKASKGDTNRVVTDRVVTVGGVPFDGKYIEAVMRAIPDATLALGGYRGGLKTLVAVGSNGTAMVMPLRAGDNMTVAYEAREIKAATEDFAPTTAEDATAAREASTPSLNDADAPSEVEAPYYEDSTSTKSDDPFTERDYKGVGNRKVKAYMSENPEVRPYFQEAAQAMLGDLQNSTRGERWYNDEAYYESGGENGWGGTKRHTTDDIAYLLDRGYSYAEIEKGLNAIIQDHGAENIAVAKRIEFALNDRLRNGYTDVYGEHIPPNEEYLKLTSKKQAAESIYNEAPMPTDADAPFAENVEQTVEDIAPVAEAYEAIKPKQTQKAEPRMKQDDTAEQTAEAEEPKVAELVAPTPQDKKKGNLANKVRNILVDKQSSVEDISLKTHNRELMAKADFMLRSETRAQRYIKNKLMPIFEKAEATGKRHDHERYWLHLHNVDRMSLETEENRVKREALKEKFKGYSEKQIQGIATEWITKDTPKDAAERIRAAREYVDTLKGKNKAVWGDSVTADKSREFIKEFEAANPDAKALSEQAIEYNKDLRQMLVDGGIVSQETADKWGNMYPHYVPIHRNGKDGAAVTVPLDSRKTGVNAPIKRAKGGNSNIDYTLETMASRTQQVFRAVARNSFGLELMHTLNTITDTQPASIDEVLDTFDNNYEELLQEGKNGANPTFTVFENGKRVTFEITEELYDALKPTNEALKTEIPVFNLLTKIQRGILTQYNPTFILTNAAKDIQDVLVNSQHPAKTYVNVPLAVKELIKGDGKYLTEYLDNGGDDLTIFDSKKQGFKKEDGTVRKVLGFAPDAIATANDFVEKIPRLAEYIASRKAGASIEVAMLDAARVTTNFAAGGDLTKFANRNGFTFLNASVQGAAQQVRNIREAKANGLKGVMKLAAKYAVAGLPVMLLNALLWDDDEDYEELSDYVKDNYYIVAKYGDGKFVRIPKGRAVAVIQNAFEQMKNLVTGDDEVDFERFAELAVTNLAPNDPLTNNVLAPVIQAVNNKTWYGDELVPTRLQDMPTEEQYDETTDSISKWLAETPVGKKFKWSPYKINYVLDQYSGGLGDVVLPYLTPESDGGGALAPFIDKFTTDSVMKNQNVSDFYDTVDELTKNANSMHATDDDILKSKYINSVRTEISELYTMKREIQNNIVPEGEQYDDIRKLYKDKKIPDKVKDELVRDIQKQIDALTKESLDTYSHIEYENALGGRYAVVGDKYFEWYEPKEGDPYWRKLDDDEVVKYNLTKNAGNAYYVTNGTVHYRFDAEDGKWVKVSDKQLERQREVTKALGITPEEYWRKTEISVMPMSNGEYEYAYENPDKYAVAKAVGGYDAFRGYSDDLYNIKADKDKNGKSISGSRKEKVVEYINNLDADYGTKIILFKSEYNADDTYNYEIIEYLNNREDISYEEMETILKELGFTVDSKGNISWD